VVLLALAALGGNHAVKEMPLGQQKLSDQWAFYHAKVIREHQYRALKLRLEVDLIERGDTMKPEARERIDALLKRFADEEKRYADEKKDIERDDEVARARARRVAPRIPTSCSRRRFSRSRSSSRPSPSWRARARSSRSASCSRWSARSSPPTVSSRSCTSR
jgi:hypothetical protein